MPLRSLAGAPVPLVLASACFAGLASSTAAEADPRASLQQIDDRFDGFHAWFGSVYDRHSGGAFYSRLARENPQAYPPHIESTSKYVRTLEWSGLIDAAPAAVRGGIVNRYLKPRQVGDPDHAWAGFFLDPGYRDLDPADNGATVTDYRAARALSFAENILDNFGAAADHPLPTAASNPDALAHLRSGAAFRGWLSERRWDRTWTAGGELLTQADAIEKLEPDKRAEVLAAGFDYLESVQQDAETGHWGQLDRGDNRDPYVLLNGAHKIVEFYTGFGRAVPHADELLDAALAEVKRERATNLLCNYNVSSLVKNLTEGSGATISDPELAEFLSLQARDLGTFKQPDGGFATFTDRSADNVFQPGSPGPSSNTDVSGLALKMRDRLHDLVNGSHRPLADAADPRVFGMSGANSGVLAGYAFEGKSLDAMTADAVTAGAFGARGTDGSGGPDGDGFHGGEGGDFSIAHSGFDDADSFYEFRVEAGGDAALDLYFLAIDARNGSENPEALESVVVRYALGESPSDADFRVAGRTRITGGAYSAIDVPLLTIDELQGLTGPVTFRIHGEGFGSAGRTFRLDAVELFGVVPGPGTLPVGAAAGAVLLRRGGR